MNEAWTQEETALYALLTITSLEEPLEEESQELEVIEGEIEEVAPPPFYKRPIPRTWGILLCSCLLIVSTTVATLLLFFTATATIEIILIKRPVSFQQTFTVSAIHSFSTSKTLSQTAKTTGRGHQDATYASGLVTLYNSLPSPQEIPQGQLLIGADGMHIITDATAYIPAGSLSVNGQTTVPAHVTIAGSQGNIQAGDVSGPCCRDYIFARNNQFSGGQYARDFSTVTQHDVDNLVKSISSQIDEQVAEDFTKQLFPTETMTPPLCSQSIVPTPTVGQEAVTVTVSVTKTCSADSYRKTGFVKQVQKQFAQAVALQFSTSYIPSGNPQVTIRSIAVKENNVKIIALMNGTIMYHFRKADMDVLKRQVAGKSKEQAGRIILKWHNIRLAGMQLQYNQSSLPNDLNKIDVRVQP
jgi:hypothetical protein